MIAVIVGLALIIVGFVLGVIGIIRECVIWRKVRSSNTMASAEILEREVINTAYSHLGILIVACLFMVIGLAVLFVPAFVP